MVKGSQWRKWDLHIHTPCSILNNGFGNDWDNYVAQLFKKAIANNIAAIGITDYFTIEGYKKLRIDYLENPSKMNELFREDELAKIKDILIVPNVEFRLKKFIGSNRINFHVIFSNEVSIADIEENFIHELDFVYESGPQTQDERRKLKIRNLETLGQKLKQEHSYFQTKSDLEVGMINAVVDDEQITQILVNRASIFKDKYFLLVPCDEDLSKIHWNSQDHLSRKILIQKADILIAGNPNTVRWGLGEFNSSKDEYINEFKSLKPCIGGSDAHHYDELFVKNEDRMVWIKAEPTFEGLRQIKFEPKQRINLSKEEPYVKEAKNIIEEVKIVSTDNTFPHKSIFFNDNLNVIIGGKSSGKSILLYNIARTLFQDNDENSLLKHYNPDTKKEEYKYQFNSDFNFIVKLKSNATQSIRRGFNEASILNDIKYIPQNYLSELAELKFKKSNELNKLVRELILEDEDSKTEYSHFITKVRQNDRLRETLINNYFEINLNIEELEKSLLDVGNRDAINQNIQNIEEEIAKLKAEAGLSDQENEKFDTLKLSTQALKKDEADIIADWKKVRDFNTEFVSILNEQISKKNLFLNSIQNPDIRNHYKLIYDGLDMFINEIGKINDDVLIDEKGSFINNSIFRAKLETIWRQVNDNSNQLKPFNLKLETQHKINELEKQREVEDKRLNEIKNIEAEIALKQQAQLVEFDKIFELYRNNYNEYLVVISNLENRVNRLEDENLKIKGIARFNYNRFKELVVGISNSTNRSYDPYQLFKNDNSSTVSIESIIEEKKGIFNRIVSGDYKLRKQTTKPQALKLLLDDYFFDYWEVSSNNDTLYKMSTGKASFIILKLIIGLSKAKAPILIDQPEDNLDNRSITKELVEYLRSKKLERQIILVTHNPNIVVNADAENIIVAHQYGQNNDDESSDYRFDYVNGALENSFPKIKDCKNVLNSMGIREHIADIVEGGEEAFKQRELKYMFK